MRLDSEDKKVYITAISKIIDDLASVTKSYFFNVWLKNIAEYLTYSKNWFFLVLLTPLAKVFKKNKWLSNYIKKLETAISVYKFYSLIYKLRQYGINKKFTASRESQGLDYINKDIAARIYRLIIISGLSTDKSKADVGSEKDTVIKKAVVKLDYRQIIALRKLYSAWIKSLLKSFGPESHTKSFIERVGKTDKAIVKPYDQEIKYDFIPDGKDLERKETNYLKLLVFLNANLTILCTALAQGLLPAVLATSAGSSLLLSILWIGIPSIIMNLVLYNKSVMILVRDIWHGRLLQNKNYGKLLIFIIALCSGISFSILFFSTSAAALNVILPVVLTGLAANTIGHIAIVFAVIIAIYAGIATTAMNFSGMVDLFSGQQSFFEQWQQFKVSARADIRTHGISKFIINNLFLFIKKLALNLIIILGAGYLLLFESNILFASIYNMFGFALPAIILVAMSAPASFMFSVNVYHILIEILKNIPAIISNIFQFIKNNYKNPIAVYESIKSLLHYVVFVALNADNSNSLAKGIITESTSSHPHCRSILNLVHINPDLRGFQIAVGIVSTADSFVANYDATTEILSDPVTCQHKLR